MTRVLICAFVLSGCTGAIGNSITSAPEPMTPEIVGELPANVTGTASKALIKLATTGNPDALHTELGGDVISSKALQEKVGSLLKLDRDEHLAPKALVTSTGETYAMVAPTITKDHFILVDSNDVVRRMDVGNTEGDQNPFIVQTLTKLPSAVTGTASEALIKLATTGNPDALRTELGGTVISSKELEKKAAGVLELDKKEHLAPKALVTKTGETYAMVAPTITKDNFILLDNQGNLMRMDVGHTEGNNMPFAALNVVEDGGTPWYVEFWYWLKG